MMVKVWLYGYMMGVRSSRKLERALHEDVGFRVLSGNQQPDHWTLEFRRRHHVALGDLFEQTVKAAADAGLVKLKHVSICAPRPTIPHRLAVCQPSQIVKELRLVARAAS